MLDTPLSFQPSQSIRVQNVSYAKTTRGATPSTKGKVHPAIPACHHRGHPEVNARGRVGGTPSKVLHLQFTSLRHVAPLRQSCSPAVKFRISPLSDLVIDTRSNQRRYLICSIPGSGRSPGGGHGHPFQYSDLENAMDRGAWRGAVHGVRVRHD